MPGPLPKPTALRQRTNRTATRAILSAETGTRRRAPLLPDRTDADGAPREWHRLTVLWWRDVWRSPMAPEFLQADIHGLYLLAELVDQFWVTPNKELAAEIRLQRQCFGLSPIDRLRLQWEVERVEAATRKQQPPQPMQPTATEDDPRQYLKVLS